MSKTRELHGIRVVIPEGWDDWSLYRFAAPRSAEAPKLALRQAERLNANVMIRRRALGKNQSVEDAMKEMNDEVRASAPSFKAQRAGRGTYQGQPMLWQDSTVVHEPSQLPVFQRQVLIPNAKGTEVIALVLSGEKADIKRMSSQMELAVSPP